MSWVLFKKIIKKNLALDTKELYVIEHKSI